VELKEMTASDVKQIAEAAYNALQSLKSQNLKTHQKKMIDSACEKLKQFLGTFEIKKPRPQPEPIKPRRKYTPKAQSLTPSYMHLKAKSIATVPRKEHPKRGH
jgi:hypothetical protein